MPFNAIVDVLEDCLDDRADYRVTEYVRADDTWLKSLARDDIYTLVQINVGVGRSFVTVHAGGAYGMRPEGSFFQYLCSCNTRYTYGRPWARVSDAGLAFGWQTVLPSDLVQSTAVPEAFGYIMGMVENMGAVARELANEAIPSLGGHLITDRDDAGFKAAVSGLV